MTLTVGITLLLLLAVLLCIVGSSLYDEGKDKEILGGVMVLNALSCVVGAIFMYNSDPSIQAEEEARLAAELAETERLETPHVVREFNSCKVYETYIHKSLFILQCVLMYLVLKSQLKRKLHVQKVVVKPAQRV